jgi:TDG/mug DNA glycosylase family protein
MPTDHKPRWDHLRLTDRIGRGVRVLFVGINPGVRSALTGHHFAGYSNRFWKLLFESGLVPRPVTYEDDVCLPEWGFGVTNLVSRPSPGIDDLKPAEYLDGRAALERKIRRHRPDVVAFVGVTLYRALFPPSTRLRRAGSTKDAVRLGLQHERFACARVFVLPNPSGRNANYTYAEMLAAFKALKRTIDASPEGQRPAGRADRPASQARRRQQD